MTEQEYINVSDLKTVRNCQEIFRNATGEINYSTEILFYLVKAEMELNDLVSCDEETQKGGK